MPSYPRRNLNIPPGPKESKPAPSRVGPPYPPTTSNTVAIPVATPRGDSVQPDSLTDPVETTPDDDYDEPTTVSWTQARDSRGRGKKRARGHRTSAGAAGAAPTDIERLARIVGKLSTEVRSLQSHVRARDCQADFDRQEIQEGRRQQAALSAELRRAREEIRQLVNDNEDLHKRLVLIEKWANSIRPAKKSYPLTKIRLRAIIDTAQAQMAHALGLDGAGETISSASLAFRICLGKDIDWTLSWVEKDRLRLAAAHELLQSLAPDQAFITLRNSPHAMHLLSQDYSQIRVSGNRAAHALGNEGELREIVRSPVAALLEHEKAGLLTIVDFVCRR